MVAEYKELKESIAQQWVKKLGMPLAEVVQVLEVSTLATSRIMQRSTPKNKE